MSPSYPPAGGVFQLRRAIIQPLKTVNITSKWYVLFFYVLNLIMVGIDLCLYIRNRKLDIEAENEKYL